jgi:hypothetical protein
MKFAETTVAGLTFQLLLIPPHWREDQPCIVDHRWATQIEEGRTSIEERRPQFAALRLTLKTEIEPADSDADDWRKGIAALSTQMVGIPLWPDVQLVGNWADRKYNAQYVVNYDDESDDFEIYAAGAVPDDPPYPYLAPLMIGRWKERPTATAVGAAVATIPLEIDEMSPWAFRIAINTLGDAWTAEPNVIDSVRDTSYYPVSLIQVSQAREAAVDEQNLAPRWKQEGDFTFCSAEDIRTALSWFCAKQGALNSWSPVPAWFQPGAATTATPNSYTARFGSDTLSLTYKSGDVAAATIIFLQEIALSGGRVQALAAKINLYSLSYGADPDNPELYTNFDSPVVGPEGTFQPAQVVHQSLRLSLQPQNEKASIQIARTEGSLMADWLLGRLYYPVTLTIWETDPAAVGGRTMLFQGLVREVTPSAPLVASASLFGGALQRKLPGWTFDGTCNVLLFSTPCSLLEAAFSSSGTMSATDVSADQRTITVHGVTGYGGPAYANNLFASGVLRTGSGRRSVQVTILSSTMSGGNLVLTTARPVWADLISAGQEVTLLPGCDGQASTCQALGNYPNFRGMQFIPNFLQQVQATTVTPKK